MASSARSSHGSCASSFRSTPPVPPSSASCSTPIQSSGSASARQRDGTAERFRFGSPSRPSGRGGLPSLSLERPAPGQLLAGWRRSEEHTSELQSLMRISYAVFCLKKKNTQQQSKYNNKQ